MKLWFSITILKFKCRKDFDLQREKNREEAEKSYNRSSPDERLYLLTYAFFGDLSFLALKVLLMKDSPTAFYIF